VLQRHRRESLQRPKAEVLLAVVEGLLGDLAMVPSG
jgi:hypothetical protein